jgi:hypothetical protein
VSFDRPAQDALFDQYRAERAQLMVQLDGH